jgi:hypothetical protein
MSDDCIQIARGSLELGVFSREEVGELLAAGFLRPTDSFRTAEGAPWQPLSELVPAGPEPAGRLDQVKGVAAKIGAKAAKATARLVALTTRGRTALVATASPLLVDYLPRIRESVGAALSNTAGTIDARLQDEAFLRKVFGAAYDTLPKPVRRFVGEESFIEFCFKNRGKLLGKKD